MEEASTKLSVESFRGKIDVNFDSPNCNPLSSCELLIENDAQMWNFLKQAKSCVFFNAPHCAFLTEVQNLRITFPSSISLCYWHKLYAIKASVHRLLHNHFLGGNLKS